jgi:membrane protein YqaA with SNARE-associated domain
MEEHSTQHTESRTVRALRSKHAEWGLALTSFLESTVLPIVLEPFLVAVTLAHPKRWRRYSFIASAASVLGGACAYLIGVLFFDLLVERMLVAYNLESAFAHATELFNGNTFFVVLIGAITPIPYKIFALSGGVLRVDFLLFILATIVGRSARFFLVGYITYRFGEHALRLFSRRFNYITGALVGVVLLYILYTFLR